MSSLAEIEAAVEQLTTEQKRELLLFVSARLREQHAKMPEPRQFSDDQIKTWIAEDEADMRRFNGPS